MAELRERGTSFKQSSENVLNDHAVEFAMSDASRSTFGTVVSSFVDDVLARIGNGVDFSSLLVSESNPIRVPVASLTVANGAGLTTPQGVIINARV